MRAIDADAFKEYITEACEDLAPLFNDNGKVARLVTENFCKDIDEQPTIQPEPLQPWEVLVAQAVLPLSPEPKKGKWILDRSGAYCCSECMEPCATYVMMKPRDKFCKMCGSRNEVTT